MLNEWINDDVCKPFVTLLTFLSQFLYLLKGGKYGIFFHSVTMKIYKIYKKCL